METPKSLQQAIQYFTDEQVCIDAVASMRWPDGPECPHCDAKEPYYLATQKRWKCRSCRKQFSVKVGTIFEDSPISLCKWLPALWMLVNDKNGISSYELHRALGISQKSAWFVLHRLRLVLKNKSVSNLARNDSGPVEVDETFVGGQPRTCTRIAASLYREHVSQIRNSDFTGTSQDHCHGIARPRTATSARHGRSERKARHAAIRNLARGRSRLEFYTDECGRLRRYARRQFVHDVVNKVKGYVRGQVHVNGIENFWSLCSSVL